MGMKLDTIISLIDMRSLTLPRFQRGYVWRRRDVSKLMRSLYLGYPVGSLLIWETNATQEDVRGDQPLAAGTHKLLLDGQQRITSLYGIIKGSVPEFSDGNPHAFRDLYFNVETQEFEFYGPTKMNNNKRWISVTGLMQKGIGPYYSHIADDPQCDTYINRLQKITDIKAREFYVESVVGADKDMDTVVDIFNQVNSGGTKLSKGDLALAKICAYWPQAREEMQARLDKWAKSSYCFNLDWMLRCINAMLTGHSDFAELDKRDFTAEDIHNGLKRAEKHVDKALNRIAFRLGLDYHRVLGSPNALPAIVRFFDKYGANFGQGSVDRLLYWYVHAMLWGRYSGPVESVIRQDLVTIDEAIDENKDAADALIGHLRHNRGDLRVHAQDFAGWSRGNRFYPLLYMLTRVSGTRDFNENIELKHGLLGGDGDFQLQLHHIFPKAQLYKHGYTRKEVNALANFTFLFRKTNLCISDKLPEAYFPYYETKNTGVLASHWIPKDERLWKIENYRDFLAARREILSQAANKFLDQLYHGKLDKAETAESDEQWRMTARPASIASDEEEMILQEAMAWMAQRNLPQGEYGYGLVDEQDNVLASFDLAWPRGIQTGHGIPVALLIDEDAETHYLANQHGFRYFTSLPDLKRYVQQEIERE